VVPFRLSPGRRARPLRRRLSRRAVPWWLATVGLAAATGLVADGLVRRADEAEAQWGSSRTVLVATRAIEPGERLAGATVPRRLPEVAVPSGAVTRSPPGGYAVDAIGRGEVVTAARVGGPGAARVAGRLAPGTRAVVVPLEAPGLPVRAGDRVDLLESSSGDPAFDGPVAPTASGPVASGALVVVVRGDALVVALDEREAVAVSRALGRGPLVPALVSPAG
jgi:Flp pilus assembly protein CpaB